MNIKDVFLLLILQAVLLSSAEITGEYSYIFGDSESLVDARNACKKLAVRNALEKFAIYIDSRSEIRNFTTEKDRIVSISEGIIRNLTVIEQDEYRQNNRIYMKVRGFVDEEQVLERLNSIKSKESETEKSGSEDYIEEYLGYQRITLISKNTFETYKITFNTLDRFISEKTRTGYVYRADERTWRVKGDLRLIRHSTKKEAIEGLYKKLKLHKDIRDYIIRPGE